MAHTTFKPIFLVIFFSLFLVACGGGGGGESTVEPTPNPGPVTPDPVDPVDPVVPDPGPNPGPVTPDPEPEPEPDPATFKAQLTWAAPVSRENGDPLMAYELAGYEIRYKKTNESNYVNVTLNDGGASSYVLPDLSAGTYDFQLAVYDVEGMYSTYAVYSNIAVGS